LKEEIDGLLRGIEPTSAPEEPPMVGFVGRRERDLEECVTYLRFPEAHHRRIRTTNRLERLNGEGHRRVTWSGGYERLQALTA